MFAKMLSDRFAGKVVRIASDMYYKDQSNEPLVKRIMANMDRPQAIDFALLVKHLKKLSKGEKVKQPIYDFAKHVRRKRTVSIEPKSVIIIEGLLILAVKKFVIFLILKFILM